MARALSTILAGTENATVLVNGKHEVVALEEQLARLSAEVVALDKVYVAKRKVMAVGIKEVETNLAHLKADIVKVKARTREPRMASVRGTKSQQL